MLPLPSDFSMATRFTILSTARRWPAVSFLPLPFAGMLALIVLAAAGCSRGGPEIVPIEGVVTHKGQPVPNLRIYFQPTDGRPSWGISDANGHFVLDYDADYDGAKVGTHKVWVLDESTNIDPTIAMSGGAQARPKRPPFMDEILAKYGRETSTLTVEVKKADRNFQLKLD
jgi:hypothetical protein